MTNAASALGPNGEVRFERALPAHADRLSALINASYSVANADRGWVGPRDFQVGERTSAAEIADLMSREHMYLLAGHLGQRLVATCSLEHRGNSAYLGMLAVDPAEQGTGLGRCLMTHAEQTALERWNVRCIEIDVIDHHEPLRAWYERMGYRPTGRRREFSQPGVSDDRRVVAAWMIQMRKQLNRP